jgi:hypothetical protein
MNNIEDYFWKANMAFQMNRFDESCQFICQAIEQIDQSHLTLDQVELIWAVIPSMYQTVYLNVKILLQSPESLKENERVLL